MMTKEAYQRWVKSEKGQASIRAAQLKYRQTAKGKATRKSGWQRFEKTEKRRLWTNKYHRERRKRDPIYRFKANLRRAVNKVLARHNASRSCRTVAMLGCSVEDFIIYIESQFDVGMSWENRGKWNIDHIIPCALFDLTKPDHQRRCFHFSNMAPMWESENKSKGCRVTNQQLRLL